MDISQQIDQFLAGAPHAVVGASADRRKYGNKVLRAFLQHHRVVYPVNPAADMVEGVTAFARLSELPGPVHGVSIITPPHVTRAIVEEALQLGIRHIWMQPGAESETAVELARAHNASVIAGGPCLLVALRFREADE